MNPIYGILFFFLAGVIIIAFYEQGRLEKKEAGFIRQDSSLYRMLLLSLIGGAMFFVVTSKDMGRVFGMPQFWTGLALGVAMVTAFYDRMRKEEKLQSEHIRPGHKTMLVDPLLLPGMIVLIFTLSMMLNRDDLLIKLGLLFFCISVYYGLLLLLLPLLRRTISARACATLWMVPTLVFAIISTLNIRARQLFVLTLPREWISPLGAVWAVGFACVMALQLFSHLAFRRHLIKSAETVTAPNILAPWQEALVRHGVKREIPVFVSQQVTTPLTVGCFDRTMRLFLPEATYTEQELQLIIRHECRHILRADTRMKLYMGFCAAVCWFNPFAWIAKNKAADDLELSCDEAVLSGAEEKTRRQYAALLLKSAGSSRGYTTCLSRSASGLRYRLKSILHPAMRFSGGVTVGVAWMLFIVTLGAGAIVNRMDTVKSLVFDKAPAGLVMDGVCFYDREEPDSPERTYRVYKYDAQALGAYLASLRAREIYGADAITSKGQELSIQYAERVNGETVSATQLRLCDGMLQVYLPYERYGYEKTVFLLEEEPDWGYIASLLDINSRPTPATQ